MTLGELPELVARADNGWQAYQLEARDVALVIGEEGAASGIYSVVGAEVLDPGQLVHAFTVGSLQLPGTNAVFIAELGGEEGVDSQPLRQRLAVKIQRGGGEDQMSLSFLGVSQQPSEIRAYSSFEFRVGELRAQFLNNLLVPAFEEPGQARFERGSWSQPGGGEQQGGRDSKVEARLMKVSAQQIAAKPRE